MYEIKGEGFNPFVHITFYFAESCHNKSRFKYINFFYVHNTFIRPYKINAKFFAELDKELTESTNSLSSFEIKN